MRGSHDTVAAAFPTDFYVLEDKESFARAEGRKTSGLRNIKGENESD